MSGSARDTIVDLGGLDAGHPALQARAEVFALTRAAEDAVIRPRDPGGLPHALRAALACRIARLNRAADLADRYSAEATGTAARVCDPGFDGGADGADARLAALIAFTDLVSTRPGDANGATIDALKAAGAGDADIVRLAELNAFVAYQVRVLAGLRLLAEWR